jgi:DNA-directed RNA polymerase specialized sigma24 family protein
MDEQAPVQQNELGANQQIDPLLQPFLRATDEAEAQLQLDRRIGSAAPVIKKITRWSRDPDDAFQETAKRLIKQLWDFKADPAGRSVSNYLYYVKVVASRVVKGQLREEHPRRRSLADALRHALNGEPRFALRVNENQERLCGLSAWRHQQTVLTRSERLIRLLDDPHIFDEAVLPGRNALSLDHAELLDAVFNWVGHPIRFDELVRIVCDLKRVEDFTPIVEADEDVARATGAAFALRSPVGKIVGADRPTFRWQPLDGALRSNGGSLRCRPD